MINIKKILVPVDFSASSELALKYAASFAMEYGAQVHLVHIIEEEVLQPGNLNDPLHTKDHWEREAAKRLEAFVPEAYRSLAITQSVRGGIIFEGIIQEATDRAADLIIIGAHGESGFVHAWLGGTAYEVARKSPCPVLTVKPFEHGFVQP